MPSSLNIRQIARVCHEANRALQIELGEVPNQPWDYIDAEMQTSAVHGVERALAGADPKLLHELWSKEKKDQGWTYGAIKDFATKRHPCLVSYDELPIEQRRKDYLFQSIVSSLTVDCG